MRETVIHRVLGAVRFLEAASRVPVREPLLITSDVPVTFRRNASGAYVIWRASGLESHTGDTAGLTDEDFQALFRAPPGTPAPASVKIRCSVEDPTGVFLPRSFELQLPRALSAAPASTPDLFQPADVLLYKSTAARLDRTGGILYTFVHDGRGQQGKIAGARVVVVALGREVGRSITGPTGEAVIEVPRLPSYVTGGGGSLTEVEIDATVTVAVRPEMLEYTSGGWRPRSPPDPDSSEEEEDPLARTADSSVKLCAGRPANVSVPVSLS